jgi:phosphoribosyl-AMP cyclohydrolase
MRYAGRWSRDALVNWLDEIAWNESGLVPAIAQEYHSGQVLTLAWMNQTALEVSIQENRAVYWSRSRGQLWRKGEQSGHVQRLREVRLDCDADAILLLVEQVGGIACHTGRARCFFRRYNDGAWHDTEPVLRDPEEIYGSQ